LELAREPSLGEAAGPLHAVSIANMMRHTRLGDGALISCLQTINQAFRQVRADPEAVLFGFDQANHVYVHEATHRSIHGLWQELVRLHTPESATAQEPFTFPPIGFAPRHLGPSEDVAAHHES